MADALLCFIRYGDIDSGVFVFHGLQLISGGREF
jgi:hypothetical protein